MEIKMGKGGQSGESITRLYTFEELHKICFPKEHRRHELRNLAEQARRKGYYKAMDLLSKVVRKYYS